MAESPVRFGDLAQIELDKMPKKRRKRALSHPHGLRVTTRVETVSDDELLEWFTPDLSNPDVLIPRTKEKYPRYRLPVRTIKFNGWYGDEETEEVGMLEEPITVDILGVRRRTKEKGPAPSWKVRDLGPLGTSQPENEAYFVARIGTRFIGEVREEEK